MNLPPSPVPDVQFLDRFIAMARRTRIAYAAAGPPPACGCGATFTSWRERREHQKAHVPEETR
jgi:hypothetical protein